MAPDLNRGIAMDQARTLRQAREAARMSQAHLAAAAGVSKRTVIRAEQGANIQDESLRCLCSVLDIDASGLVPARKAEPATPQAMLREHVDRHGEEVLWEGVPDPAGWREEVRYGSLLWAHAALAVAALAAAGLYASTLQLQVEGQAILMGPSTWLAVAGLLLSLAMVGHVLGAVRGVERSRLRLETSLHAMTDRAFYTARVKSWDPTSVMAIERVELPERRDGCRVRPRSPLWPMSRSIRLANPAPGAARTIHVEGIPDLQGLARLMRGEPVAA